MMIDEPLIAAVADELRAAEPALRAPPPAPDPAIAIWAVVEAWYADIVSNPAIMRSTDLQWLLAGKKEQLLTKIALTITKE